MSSFWKGTSERKLINAEYELLKLSGLDLDSFQSYPVYILSDVNIQKAYEDGDDTYT